MPHEVRDHWCRITMYEGAKEVFEAEAADLDVFEISGAAFSDLLPWRSYRNNNRINVCKDDWFAEVKGANLIVLDQVLEHVSDPWAAVRNVAKALPEGGKIFVSTPFLIRFHPDPHDHWRWTKSGLALILEAGGFEKVGSDSWGNKACIAANFKRWVMYKPEEHSLMDEPLFPITVWGWGTKPAAKLDSP